MKPNQIGCDNMAIESYTNTRTQKYMLAHARHSDQASDVKPAGGGKEGWPGDNSGEEVCTTRWSTLIGSRGWGIVRRFNDPLLQEQFAQNIEDLINTGKIGYGHQSSSKRSCYTLIKALMADNYYDPDHGTSYMETFDYDEWADSGWKRQVSSDPALYRYKYSLLDPQTWDIQNLNHYCAIQCNGLAFTAFQLMTGLWWRYCADPKDSTKNIYYLSTQPNPEFKFSYTTSRLFIKELTTANWTKPTTTSYHYVGETHKCFHEKSYTVKAKDIYSNYSGDADITMHDIVFKISAGEDQNTEKFTQSIQVIEDETSDGRSIHAHVYRYLYCLDATFDSDGNIVSATPVMSRYKASSDGETLVEYAYDNDDTEDFKIIEQPVNYVGPVNSTALFKINVQSPEGVEPTYKWQYQLQGSSVWNTGSFTGQGTPEYSVKLTSTRDYQKYRCVVSIEDDDKTLTLYSDEVEMHIGEYISDLPQEETEDILYLIKTPYDLKRGDILGTRGKYGPGSGGHCAIWI